MKTNQVYSILLCVLVGSTLGHDYQRAKFLAPQARSKLISPFERAKREVKQEHCHLQCSSGDGGDKDLGLEIIVNKTTNIIAIVNASAHVALVIDVNTNLVALLNGTVGGAVVFNLKTSEGVYIESSNNVHLWLASKIDIHAYLSTLTTLQVIIDLNIGVKFNLKTVSEAILKVVGALAAKLIVDLSLKLESDLRVGLNIVVQISKTFVGLLSGTLKGFLTLVVNESVRIKGDLQHLQYVLIGIGTVVKNIEGGIEALIKAKVEFDLAILLAAANGVELLGNLILVISGKVNTTSLAGILNSVEGLFGLIVTLGGGVSYGVTGVFKVLSSLVAYIKGKIKIDVLIGEIVEFSSNKKGEIDIQIYVSALLEVIKFAKLNDNNALSGCVEILINIQAGKLFVEKINLSAVITQLVGPKTGLVLVITVLIVIVGVIAISLSIPALLLFLIGQLTSAVGIALLARLGIVIKVAAGAKNVLDSIIKGTNIPKLTVLILKGDIIGILELIPGCREIYAALKAAISASGSTEIHIDVILKGKSASSIVAEIIVTIKGAFGIGGATPKPTTTIGSIGTLFGKSTSIGTGSGSTESSVDGIGISWKSSRSWSIGGISWGGIGGIHGSSGSSSTESSGGNSSGGGGLHFGGSHKGGWKWSIKNQEGHHENKERAQHRHNQHEKSHL